MKYQFGLLPLFVILDSCVSSDQSPHCESLSIGLSEIGSHETLSEVRLMMHVENGGGERIGLWGEDVDSPRLAVSVRNPDSGQVLAKLPATIDPVVTRDNVLYLTENESIQREFWLTSVVDRRILDSESSVEVSWIIGEILSEKDRKKIGVCSGRVESNRLILE